MAQIVPVVWQCGTASADTLPTPAPVAARCAVVSMAMAIATPVAMLQRLLVLSFWRIVAAGAEA